MTPSEHERRVAEYDADRREAFKRIQDEFEKPRRRTKEMLKWYREHPSPRTAAEQLDNIRRALTAGLRT